MIKDIIKLLSSADFYGVSENIEIAKVPTNKPNRMFDWVLTLNEDSRSHTPAKPVMSEAMMALNATTSISLISKPKMEKLGASSSSGSKE